MPPSVLRWAFYSPTRLAVVSLVVAGIVVGGVVLARAQVHPPPQQVTQPRQPVTRLSTPTPTTRPDDQASVPGERVPRSVRTTIVRSARAFVDAWARDARPQSGAVWLREIRPLTTPSLYRGLRVTDPARLPRGPVRRVHLRQVGPFAGAAVVALGGGLRVDVRLVSERARWLVADIEPAGP